MKSIWDHLALVLYAAVLMLFCILITSLRSSEKREPGSSFLIAAASTDVPTTFVPVYTAESRAGSGMDKNHKPERTVLHSYRFDRSEVEKITPTGGMLKKQDFAGSRYITEPSRPEYHVFHEENGMYDSFMYGTGPIGNLDAYAKYIFRYDALAKSAVSFVQEQHIDSGPGMAWDQLPVYVAHTRYLLDAVFSGSDADTANDKRKIEELALYFFTSYIPANPAVPAVLHFSMPAYTLTFVMDSDVFITMLSPDGVPFEYTVENAAD